MKEFENITDILDFAINREQMSIDFYVNLSQNSRNQEMKDVFLQFAKEEMQHKSLIEKVKTEGDFNLLESKIKDIKIADYIVQKFEDKANLTYDKALILAMLREKAAYDLYLKLAKSTHIQKYIDIFNSLADEELKHKNRFEVEYDDYLRREN